MSTRRYYLCSLRLQQHSVKIQKEGMYLDSVTSATKHVPEASSNADDDVLRLDEVPSTTFTLHMLAFASAPYQPTRLPS